MAKVGAPYLSLTAAALLLAGCAFPPTDKPVGTPGAGQMPAFVGSGTVKRIETLPGGAQQTLSYDTLYARDEHGRTRVEGVLPGLTATDTEGNQIPLRVIEIHDPVAKISWLIYPDQKEAYERNDTGAQAVALLDSGWMGGSMAITFGSGPPTATQLGTRTIAGLQAQGRRTIRNDGATPVALGNGVVWTRVQPDEPAPQAIASEETWTSPTLGNVTLARTQTSVAGTEMYSFTANEVTLGEPPASLFQPDTALAVRDTRADFELAKTLFHSARDAAADLSGPLGATEVEQVAQAESMAMRRDKDWWHQAHSDGIAAFKNLVSTPFPKPDPPPPGRPSRPDLKEQIESQLLRTLLQPPIGGRVISDDDLRTVLDLVRGADVRKSSLYSVLMERPVLGPRPNAANDTAVLDPVTLAAECQQADGSFPYQGVLSLSSQMSFSMSPGGAMQATPQDRTGERTQLMNMAFSAIEADRDSAGLLDESRFLQQTAPRADVETMSVASIIGPPPPPFSYRGPDYTAFRSDWVEAAKSLLTNHPVASNSWAMPVLQELERVDPDAAAGLGVAPPAQATNSMQPVPNPAQNPLSPQGMRQDPAAALQAAQNASGSQQLQSYVNLANFAAQTDPAIAAQAATLTAAALDNAPSSNASQTLSSQLALSFFRLGMAEQAEAMVAKLLGQAAKDAQTAWDKYNQMTPEQQEQSRFTGSFGSVVSEYRSAAEIDFPAAAAAAQQLSVDAIRPLVLAEVAGMAQ